MVMAAARYRGQHTHNNFFLNHIICKQQQNDQEIIYKKRKIISNFA